MKKEKKEKILKEFAPEIVAQALYVINKKAKEIRDSLQDTTNFRNYMEVENAMYEKEELYELKDEVLNIADKLGWLKLLGYHQQVNEKYEYQMESWDDFFERHGYNDYDEPDEYFYLNLFEFAGFQFHVPGNRQGNFLGSIGIISADKIETKIDFETAKEILKRFVDASFIQKEIDFQNKLEIKMENNNEKAESFFHFVHSKINRKRIAIETGEITYSYYSNDLFTVDGKNVRCNIVFVHCFDDFFLTSQNSQDFFLEMVKKYVAPDTEEVVLFQEWLKPYFPKILERFQKKFEENYYNYNP